MRQICFGIAAAVIIASLAATRAAAATEAVRVHERIDGGWLFQRVADTAAQDAALKGTDAPAQAQPAFNDASWTPVHLPHDFVVQGAFDRNAPGDHGFLPAGCGWYRRNLTVPATASGKRVSLVFDGVYRDSRVWINGHFAGEHECGYTGFRYDITGIANPGARTTIAVFVDARKPEGWWYEGGGIYRHVYMDIDNPVSVAPYGTFVTSRVEENVSGERARATISVSTTVQNETRSPAAVQVVSTVIRPDNSVAGTATTGVTVGATGRETVRQTVAEPDARLWSLESPHMYRLKTAVLMGGKLVDTCETPFGIRTILFDPDKGFFLNGKSVKIQGTCNHQDFAGVGIAMPDGLMEWRLKKLKEMGSNAYRTSHDEVAPALLDACDRLGMLVMDETRHFGDGENPKAPADTPAVDLANLKQQVLQDRNHPSVILWSIGNEEPQQGSKDGARIGLAMKAVVDSLDGTRPVTEAIIGGHTSGSSNILDVEGFNYWPDGYDWFHRTRPRQPIIGSEIASALSTRGVYSMDPFAGAGVTQHGSQANGWVAAYDVNGPSWGQTAEDAWKPIADRPYVCGGFVWTGFDYRGEPTPFYWPCVSSAFGILDTCGFPKDSYYFYQSVWTTRPMVHLLPHWTWPGKEGQTISVWAYSNAERVELFLNGRSLGARAVPRCGHVEWSVPYSPGVLAAQASTSGKIVARDQVETAGAPAAIRLSSDRTVIEADGEDEAPAAAAVVDSAGRVVPFADNLIRFTVAGPASIAGVGNGNPSSHEADCASRRQAFNGLCMALVRASEASGRATLTAEADGLAGATITIQTRR